MLFPLSLYLLNMFTCLSTLYLLKEFKLHNQVADLDFSRFNF